MINTPHLIGPAFATLAGLVGIAITIFWLVVGWRAMRAHERLAQAAEELARKSN